MNCNNKIMTNVDINSGAIDGTTIATSNITVGTGKILDVTNGTLLLSNNQISGNSVEGGTINSIAITNANITNANISKLTGNMNCNNHNMLNVDIDSGAIDGTNITVGTGKTLNVSAGTLTLRNNQISGDKINGGTIDSINITNANITNLTGNITNVIGDLDVDGDIISDNFRGSNINNLQGTNITFGLNTIGYADTTSSGKSLIKTISLNGGVDDGYNKYVNDIFIAKTGGRSCITSNSPIGIFYNNANVTNTPVLVFNYDNIYIWDGTTGRHLMVEGYSTPSDDRKKFNEIPLLNALNLINKLKPRKYTFSNKILSKEEEYELENSDITIEDIFDREKDKDKKGFYWSREEIGLIAQDVQQINDLSWCVTENGVNSNGFALNYNSLFTLNIKATQELDKKCQEYESNVNKQTLKNNLQEKIINELNQNVTTLESENATIKTALNILLVSLGKDPI